MVGLVFMVGHIIFTEILERETDPQNEVEFKLMNLTGNTVKIEAYDSVSIYLVSKKTFVARLDNEEFLSLPNPDGKYSISTSKEEIKEIKIILNSAIVDAKLTSGTPVRVLISTPSLIFQAIFYILAALFGFFICLFLGWIKIVV